MNKLIRYYNQNRGFIIMFIIVIALIIIIIQMLNSLIAKDQEGKKANMALNMSNNNKDNTAIARKRHKRNYGRKSKKFRNR